MAGERSYPPARELAEAFFREARSAFGFLTEDHGVVAQCTVRGFVPDEFDRTDLASLPDEAFFLAEVRWRGPAWRVRATYGEVEFEVNARISVGSEADQPDFALWEWLEALGEHSGDVKDCVWAMQPERMKRVVNALGSALRAHHTEILNASGDLVGRVRDLREHRMAAWADEQRDRERRRASARAADAFREHKYGLVVDLLERFVDRLSPAEMKKLEYARERLGSHRKE